MANGAATYTTYLRTELDPATRQSYSQLRTLAESTYRDINRFATEASNASAASAGDRRAATAFRQLEINAGGTFASIRREANATGAAVSAMQARLSNIRADAIGGTVSGRGAVSTTGAVAANDNLTASNRRLAATTQTVSEAQRRQQVTTRAIGTETSKLGGSLQVLGTTLSVVQGPLGPIAGRINAITAAVTQLGTGTLILAGAATALFAFAGVASVYAEVESRLKPLYTSQEQVNAALRETGRIALATRSALGPTADLYAKLTSAGRDYNLTSRQVSRVTETAAKAATLSGGNEASRAAGLYQFSQGLSSGKLGGDELRSILENIPELARAIAEGFKNADGSIGTTIGTLRKLGAEGALSTKAVVDALTNSAALVDAKFSKLPKTISSAKTEFITTFTLMTGQIDHTIGVTSTLANVISTAAANMQLLLALGGAMGARFILPKLGGFLTDIRTAIALQRQLNTGAANAAAAGAATLLTPKGIERAKATTGFNESAAAANQARARVAAEAQIVAAIDAEIAKTAEAGAADVARAREATVSARTAVTATETRIAALRTELAQTVELRAAAAAQVSTFASAAPLVARPLASGETDATRTARITAFTQQQSAAKLELAQADLRASAAARALAAAEIELEATLAATTAATLTGTTAANASAARGFGLLGLAEQRIAANVALAASTAEVAVADTALAAAETRLTAAQIAYNTAATIGTTVMTGLRAAATAVSTALGGPVMIALTVVTGAMIYLAGQTNAALDALHNFAGGQAELERRLGITTDKLKEQSNAARELALNLAQAGVVKARNARADANVDLSKSLQAAAGQLAPGGSLGVGRLVEGQQQGRDTDALLSIAASLRNGMAISPEGIAKITEIQKRNPEAFKAEGISGALLRFQGSSPADVGEKTLGVEASRLTLKDAMATLQEVKTELAKPRVAPKVTTPLTRDQILAQGTSLGETINGKREILDRRFQQTKDRILSDKDDTEQEKIDKIADATAGYNEQVKALDRRDAAAARGTARRAAAEDAKAVREAAKATREAAQATERLADLRSKYDEQPKLVDQVSNDQRAIQALVGRTVNVAGPDGTSRRETYTQAQATLDQAKAQDALNKPFADMTREMDRQRQIQLLTAQGRTAEADALGRAFQLIDRTGTLQAGQYEALVRSAQAQETLNDKIAERGRLVSTLSSTVDDLRNDVSTFLSELNQGAGKASVNFGRSLVAGFSRTSTKLFVDNLFGGTQKRIDDLISGKTALSNATTFTAQQATRTGGIVQRFGDVVGEVTDRVEQTLAKMNGTSPADQSGLPEAFQNVKLGESIASALTSGGLASDGDPRIRASLGLPPVQGKTEADGEDIVVTAKRIAKAETAIGGKPPTLREIYNETGKSIGEKIDSALGTKFASKVGSKLGNVLQGASTGSAAAGIFGSVFGGKGSAAGAQLGGAIGGALSSITAVTSALGPFGAALSPVLGIAGSLVGGLFKSKKEASSTLAFDATTGQLTGGAGIGSGKEAKSAATQLGGALASQLNDIAEQLGGNISGNGGVSIGYRPGHKAGAFRVDPTGQGKVKDGNVEAYETEQEAIAAALRVAITNGVISGISQASQNILRSGQDLQKALEKALLIESIPKRLLAIQNPVKSAITELNTEFTKIIAVLNEGKASSQQYAEAQQLYDLERARTLAEAQKTATSAIDAYLKNMTAGSSSPLNKATVYANASSDLNKLAADVRAGKVVDDGALTDAAQKFQDASRALNGSDSKFFNDFDMLKTLLEQAQKNAGTVTAGVQTDLPGSPFSSAAVQQAIASGSNATVKATQEQTQALSDKFDRLIDAVSYSGGVAASGGSGYSSMDNLAAFRSSLA